LRFSVEESPPSQCQVELGADLQSLCQHLKEIANEKFGLKVFETLVLIITEQAAWNKSSLLLKIQK